MIIYDKHICQVIYTPCFLVYRCGIYHFYHVLHSITYLRHFCKEQICANPFFRPVQVIGALRKFGQLSRTWRELLSPTPRVTHMLLSKLHGCILTRYARANASIGQFLNTTYSSQLVHAIIRSSKKPIIIYSNALDTFITSRSKLLTASCIKRRKYSKYRKC